VRNGAREKAGILHRVQAIIFDSFSGLRSSVAIVFSHRAAKADKCFFSQRQAATVKIDHAPLTF